MLVGQVLKHSDQLNRLSSYKFETLLHLHHSSTVLYVLRSGSPVDVLRMLRRNHLGQLLNERKNRISNDISVYRQLFEALDR
jgi:hypothetical protein